MCDLPARGWIRNIAVISRTTQAWENLGKFSSANKDPCCTSQHQELCYTMKNPYKCAQEHQQARLRWTGGQRVRWIQVSAPFGRNGHLDQPMEDEKECEGCDCTFLGEHGKSRSYSGLILWWMGVPSIAHMFVLFLSSVYSSVPVSVLFRVMGSAAYPISSHCHHRHACYTLN